MISGFFYAFNYEKEICLPRSYTPYCRNYSSGG